MSEKTRLVLAQILAGWAVVLTLFAMDMAAAIVSPVLKGIFEGLVFAALGHITARWLIP